MKKKVIKYILENDLFKTDDKILLAISGGADSTAMLCFLIEYGVKFELAHANFNLRGQESLNDELFVRKLSKKYALKFHLKKFNTIAYSKRNNISLQMAARKLRYDWFKKLIKTINFDYIITAHNQDDLIETFLINLLRGSGIKGLSSIPVKNEKIIRPFLAVTRFEIEDYLKQKNQLYRTDSSNSETKYIRNKIRHNIIPSLMEINPSVKKNIISQISILRETSKIFESQMKMVKKKIILKQNDCFFISKDKIMKLSPLNTYLYEILSDFGFKQINQIIKALNFSGKRFFTNKYELIIDRKDIIIKKRNINSDKSIKIAESALEINSPLPMRFSIKHSNKYNKSNNFAHIDFEKLSFPLSLRKWIPGDKFQPLGMKNFMKISDFYINNKLSQFEKEETWLLCSDTDIVWVVGYRIDERFKVTLNTKKLYIAELLNLY